MPTLTQTLLARIEAYCRDTGVTERAFGLAVVNNHKLVARLRADCGITGQTHDRILRYIEAHPAGIAADVTQDAA